MFFLQADAALSQGTLRLHLYHLLLSLLREQPRQQYMAAPVHFWLNQLWLGRQNHMVSLKQVDVETAASPLPQTPGTNTALALSTLPFSGSSIYSGAAVPVYAMKRLTFVCKHGNMIKSKLIYVLIYL